MSRNLFRYLRRINDMNPTTPTDATSSTTTTTTTSSSSPFSPQILSSSSSSSTTASTTTDTAANTATDDGNGGAGTSATGIGTDDTTATATTTTTATTTITMTNFNNHNSAMQSSSFARLTASASSLRHRHNFSSFATHSHAPTHETQLKPIYIYPGLLRIVRDKAIALDNQCPAVLYKCRDCRRERDRDRDNQSPSNLPKHVTSAPETSCPRKQHPDTTPVSTAPSTNPTTTTTTNSTCDISSTPVESAPERPDSPALPDVERTPGRPVDAPHVPLPERDRCPHQTSCAICLEEFHSKDLVRKLPCNVNHVFHSKCILDWFVSHHRCPLCNETVANVSSDVRTISSNPISSSSSATSAAATPLRPHAPHDPDRRNPFRQRRRMASDFIAEVRRARASRVPRSPSDSTQTATSPLSSPPPPQSQRNYHLRNRSNGRRRSTLRAAFASVSRHSPVNHDHFDTRHRADVSSAPTRSLPPRPLSSPATRHSANATAGVAYPRRGGSLRHAVGDRSARVNPPPTLLVQETPSPTNHPTAHDQSANPSAANDSTRTDACHDIPARTAPDPKSCDSASDRVKKKGRGPRTYSYIVHDNVRMEMNPVIPV